MEEQSFSLMDGKLHVYRRENSRYWQCSTFLGGRNHRVSTKEETQLRAEEYARDWYAERLVDDRRRRRGELDPLQVSTAQLNDRRRRPKVTGPTFRDAAEQFMSEFEVITRGQRSPLYLKAHRIRLDRHVLPFFGDRAVKEITSGDVTAYRAHRMRTGLARKAQPRTPEAMANAPAVTDDMPRPARSTLHQEIVCLRQVLKTALRNRWIDHLPDLSEPYRKAPKISHRAWFSPQEYKQLYEATRERVKNPPRPRWLTAYENLHDFVLFAVNTGLRPDEALRLEYRDVAIVTDEPTGERLLEIEVRGKRGTGYCKSMPGAVHPFKRLRDRNPSAPTDRLFPKLQRELFNTILEELNLKEDREGNARTFYSLRHTYICFRLMEGADIYQIAKNCRTSVEMIENFYASHIKNTLDAAAINVRRQRSKSSIKKKIDRPKPAGSTTRSKSALATRR